MPRTNINSGVQLRTAPVLQQAERTYPARPLRQAAIELSPTTPIKLTVRMPAIVRTSGPFQRALTHLRTHPRGHLAAAVAGAAFALLLRSFGA